MKASPFTTLKKSIVSVTAASLLMTSALSADCTYQLFTISSEKGTNVGEFIDQLSDECSFSVIIADIEAEKTLKKALNKTKLKNLTIDEVLDIILTENDLSYTLENNILKVSYLQTKTFNIDYILSQRKGLSSTDILLSSKSGTEGSGTDAGTSAAQSSGETETGMKIETSDEVIFWEELDLELQRVLNRPEDLYQAEAPIINKNAGMVTVSATVKQINRLEEYLKELQKKVQYQVLIDVNLLAVTLSDGSSTGVDWRQLYALQNFNLTADLMSVTNVETFTEGAIEDVLIPGTAGTAKMFQAQGAASLNEVIKFLKSQGDVKAISNPKVLTLNNQPALITVGTEYFYSVEQSSNLQGTGGGVTTTVQNTVVSSVFAGVLLDITPEISHDGTITLKINPSITQTAQDIAGDNTDRTMPPDLERRQLASVVTVQDGERVILGGLINTKKMQDEHKVPLLGDIPILGWAFKYEETSTQVQELVMVIEPHIIDKAGSGVSLTELGYTGINETNLKEHAFSMGDIRKTMEKIDEERPKEIDEGNE
ncbi:MAG: pilus (MSHA type) biogenesis protein MshL [Campylobacterota bacterium]|nr:pilus (MSHA type) biogenesis protein MshL [Campylobacterota bacterium]